MMNLQNGMEIPEAVSKSTKTYGRFSDAVKVINPRKE